MGVPARIELYKGGIAHMFIVTAKLSRKKAIAIALILALLLGAVILLAGRRDQSGQEEPDTVHIPAETAQDIVAYLNGLGWQVSQEPVEVQEVLIPREFNEAYAAYNEIQKRAGFDLSNYSGQDAVRYTYQILNYPGQEEEIVADVLVSNGQIIGGNIQSIRLDGFMHELRPRE